VVADEAPAFYGADLAFVHHVGFGEFVEAAAPEFSRLLIAAGIRDGLIVDLGCGSGILARELTAQGYDVMGVDRSESMLAIARATAPRATLVQSAIAAVRLPPCRAVFAIGESISYLPESARRPPSLASLFGRVARALDPGGLFVFDLVTRGGGPLMAYRTWQAGADWAVLVDVREDAVLRTITRNITTFRGTGRAYRRSAERHAVGVYNRTEVVRWLRDAELGVAVQRHYGRVVLPPRRMAFLARKKTRKRK
jgi:SAM-dependent methyltransferase